MEKKLALAADRRRSKHLCPPSPKAAPWLVIPHGKSGENQVFYSHFPNDKSTCYCWKSIPELSNKSFRFWQSPSHEGWLVILCYESSDEGDVADDHQYLNSKWKQGDCFLWNPVSFDTIKLPTLLRWFNISIPTRFNVNDCVLSSPPTSPDNDSMVYFLFSGLECTSDHFLVFCRPSSSMSFSWAASNIDIPTGTFTSVASPFLSTNVTEILYSIRVLSLKKPEVTSLQIIIKL